MRRLVVAAAVVLFLAVGTGVFISLNSRVERLEYDINKHSEKYYFFNKMVGERHFKNGVLEGRTATYYSNGNLKTEWLYSAGKKNGLSRTYTAEGNLKYEDEYKDDQRVSRKEFDERGNLTSQTK